MMNVYDAFTEFEREPMSLLTKYRHFNRYKINIWVLNIWL